MTPKQSAPLLQPVFFGSTEIAAPPEIINPESTVKLAFPCPPAHFLSFWTTDDVARVTGGATR